MCFFSIMADPGPKILISYIQARSSVLEDKPRFGKFGVRIWMANIEKNCTFFVLKLSEKENKMYLWEIKNSLHNVIFIRFFFSFLALQNFLYPIFRNSNFFCEFAWHVSWDDTPHKMFWDKSLWRNYLYKCYICNFLYLHELCWCEFLWHLQM